ncbi:MAG: ATP-dependent Clp protease adaptor ClpS [Gemmataceae bacterium]|nr:ATP-dependent Clp protease adaptor ClpS [Gemmataceae bacterium]
MNENTLPETIVITKSRPKERTRRLPPYHVILENDDYHSFDWVVDVLRQALGCTEQKAIVLASEAHCSGRAVVWTGAKEVAELKQEQIQSFHEIRPDGRKLGPLGVTIEPAV